jgi:hypothetical protein
MPPEEPSAGPERATEPEIDLQALAEKVYELLKRELTIERERLGWKRGR